MERQMLQGDGELYARNTVAGMDQSELEELSSLTSFWSLVSHQGYLLLVLVSAWDLYLL